MKKFLLAVIVGAAATAATAQTMNAETFYKRATALQKKGALAIFSRGEISALMKEGQAAGKKAGDQRRADMAAGRKPRFCPPPGAKNSMDSNEYMKRLGAIPASDRARIDTAEATTRILATKYPCTAR